MKCLVCLLHITKRSNHLGCMGSIIFTNIPDRTSSIRSNIIHNTTDNLSLFCLLFHAGFCPKPKIAKNCLEVVTTLSNRSIWWKAKRTSCMILVNASLSSLVVGRPYYFRINYGIRVPELFGCKMIVCHFESVLQIPLASNRL